MFLKQLALAISLGAYVCFAGVLTTTNFNVRMYKHGHPDMGTHNNAKYVGTHNTTPLYKNT